MHGDYHEIIEAMGEPKWWNEYAVPRYVDFHPQEVAYIYADEVILLEIQCQACDKPFHVCASAKSEPEGEGDRSWPIADSIRENTVEWGDPPNVNCCIAGNTMTAVPIRVLEYWRHPLIGGFTSGWERNAELEREIDCAWA